MVIDVKLTRDESTSWGFRLAGGADFDAPLMVTKVNEGSIAEKCGLREGDIVVRVNYEPTIDLPHIKVQEMIMGCTNSFVLGVQRENEEEVENGFDKICCESLNGDTNGSQTSEKIVGKCRPESVAQSELSETDSIINELGRCKVSEEHIAEMISGESEVLKEHNVIGINFQKIMPKSSYFKSSEVFKTLNEEAIKTKADRDKEVKRWTTFLQKPDRPIPKPRSEREKPATEPYRVMIVKQPKPKCDPKRPSTPPSEVEEKSNEATNDEETVKENGESKNEQDEIQAEVDGVVSEVTEATNLEQPNAENVAKITSEKEENVNGDDQNVTVNGDSESKAEKVENEIENASPKMRYADDDQLNQRLVEVQNQLAALSTLPSTIQATLEAVSRQLNELMPAFKIRTSIDITGTMNDTTEMTLSEEIDIEKESNDIETTENGTETMETGNSIKETGEVHIELKSNNEANECVNGENGEIQTSENTEAADESQDTVDQIAALTEEQILKMKTETTFMKQEQEWCKNKATIGEKHQALAESVAKKAQQKSNNGPRTPQERPVVLPGGRKWRNAKDAYNEDFIAEVLSSQAELITGSTLGKYESPLLGYDDRVNFLKYKKPEKDLSCLNNSEVFKLIHNADGMQPNQISVRPEKVVAAHDVYPAHG